MKDRLFSDRVFLRKLWNLALPVAFQSLMLAAVAAADAIMLGNVAQNDMSAVSMATQIQFIQNTILLAAVSALAALGAQYWGKNDHRSLNDVFAIGLRVCAVVDFIFFAGCVFFPRTLMSIYTDVPQLIDIGARYLTVAGWSYLITGISLTFQTLMKISERAGKAAVISSCSVVLNIVLNAVLIFGISAGGTDNQYFLAPMGVLGAATATLLARAIELIWSVAVCFRHSSMKLEINRFWKRNKLLTGDFMRCMWPLVGAGLFWGVGFTAYTAFIGHMGSDAVAANSVVAIIRDLVCCLCSGIATGGGIIVGNELGAGKLAQGKLYGIRVAKLSYLCGAVSCVLMLIAAPFAVRIVRLSEEASGYLIGMMLVMAVYMIGRAVNTVIINGIFAAGGDTAFDMYSLAVCMWGLAIPLAAAGTFLFHWPVVVVYACTCLDEVGKIPWVMLHFRKYVWVRDLTR